jgi:hypothetical protein
MAWSRRNAPPLPRTVLNRKVLGYQGNSNPARVHVARVSGCVSAAIKAAAASLTALAVITAAQ